MEYITQEKLNELLEYWQCRLRLRDWRIKAKLVPRNEINDVGHIKYSQADKEALITIDETGNPIMYGGGIFDFEMLLIHELLEIYLDPITVDIKQLDKEVAVNMITEALIKEHRT